MICEVNDRRLFDQDERQDADDAEQDVGRENQRSHGRRPMTGRSGLYEWSR
jgi:hypothetical protein